MYRHQDADKHLNHTWRLAYQITFQAQARGAKLNIGIPSDTSKCRVYKESQSHSGLRTSLSRNTNTGFIENNAYAIQTGFVRYVASYDLHINPKAKWKTKLDRDKSLAADRKAHFLKNKKHFNIEDQSVQTLMSKFNIQKVKKENLIHLIYNYCHSEISKKYGNSQQNVIDVLATGKANTLERSRAMVALLRAAHIPARLVTGFDLKENLFAHPHHWVEVYLKNRWLSYDPEVGYEKEVPASFLPVTRESQSIISAEKNASLSQVQYSITKIDTPPGLKKGQSHSFLEVLDLTRLPIAVQKTLTLVLLLPFCALITAFFRNILGLITFGTFTPTLLALGFVFADWMTGAIMFFAVLVTGFLTRTILENFKLLMIPRLSILLTLVVLCMIMSVSILDYYQLTPSTNAVLLPIVILVMLIERMYITAEEDGHAYTFKMCLGTFCVALICFSAIQSERLAELIIVFPEIHFITIALLLWLGRYSGYRLSELWRFKDMVALIDKKE